MNSIPTEDSCWINAASHNSLSVRIKVEKEIVSEQGSEPNDSESGMREIKVENDAASEDDMTSIHQFMDISAPIKEDAGINFELVKTVKIEKELMSEAGAGISDAENGTREIKVEKADALSEDLTSSDESIPNCSSSSQFVDISVLTKGEDLGTYIEEEAEASTQENHASSRRHFRRALLFSCDQCPAQFSLKCNLQTHLIDHCYFSHGLFRPV